MRSAPEGPSPSTSPDDLSLIASLRSGDKSAARSFYARTKPVVDRMVIRLMGAQDQEREDIAQIAIMSVLQSIPSFRGECSLDTWICRVTARTCFREIRKRKGRARVVDRRVSGDEADVVALCVDRQTLMRDLLERIRRHLDAVDQNKAWAFLLHDVCGYDLKEVATMMEASVAATQSRLVRGRAELTARIESDSDLCELLRTKKVER